MSFLASSLRFSIPKLLFRQVHTSGLILQTSASNLLNSMKLAKSDNDQKVVENAFRLIDELNLFFKENKDQNNVNSIVASFHAISMVNPNAFGQEKSLEELRNVLLNSINYFENNAQLDISEILAFSRQFFLILTAQPVLGAKPVLSGVYFHEMLIKIFKMYPNSKDPRYHIVFFNDCAHFLTTLAFHFLPKDQKLSNYYRNTFEFIISSEILALGATLDSSWATLYSLSGSYLHSRFALSLSNAEEAEKNYKNSLKELSKFVDMKSLNILNTLAQMEKVRPQPKIRTQSFFDRLTSKFNSIFYSKEVNQAINNITADFESIDAAKKMQENEKVVTKPTVVYSTELPSPNFVMLELDTFIGILSSGKSLLPKMDSMELLDLSESLEPELSQAPVLVRNSADLSATPVSLIHDTTTDIFFAYLDLLLFQKRMEEGITLFNLALRHFEELLPNDAMDSIKVQRVFKYMKFGILLGSKIDRLESFISKVLAAIKTPSVEICDQLDLLAELLFQKTSVAGMILRESLDLRSPLVSCNDFKLIRCQLLYCNLLLKDKQPANLEKLAVFISTIKDNIIENRSKSLKYLLLKIRFLNIYAAALFEQKNFQLSAEIYQSCLALINSPDMLRFGPSVRVLEASVLNNSTKILFAQENFTSAEFSLMETLSMCEQIEHIFMQSVVLSNLGTVYHSSKQFEKSIPILNRVVMLQSELFRQSNIDPTIHPTVAIARRWLANSYFQLGQYDEAEKILKSILPILEKSMDPVKYAFSAFQYMNILSKTNRIQEAEEIRKKLSLHIGINIGKTLARKENVT